VDNGVTVPDLKRAEMEAEATIEGALSAAAVAPWPEPQSAFTNIQDIGATP
jgi:hypothetical protein